MIPYSHLRLICRHLAPLFREFTEPWVGRTVTSALAIEIADEMSRFTDSLKQLVATLGTDQVPDLEWPDEDWFTATDDDDEFVARGDDGVRAGQHQDEKRLVDVSVKFEDVH